MNENKDARINEELIEKVAGGSGASTGICPRCHKYVTIYSSGSTLTCSDCGYSWTTAY